MKSAARRDGGKGGVLTERISTWLRSKFSSVRVERRKMICALTMVWMLGLALPSMAGVRARFEASVMRRPTWPPPRAVLEDLGGGEGDVWDKTDRGRLEQRAVEMAWRTVCVSTRRRFQAPIQTWWQPWADLPPSVAHDMGWSQVSIGIVGNFPPDSAGIRRNLAESGRHHIRYDAAIRIDVRRWRLPLSACPPAPCLQPPWY